MRAPLVRLGCLLSLLIASSASSVTMAWTPVGNPGNAADNTGFGAVGYAYNIGTYEVTNAQYTEFLNAKAKSDPLALYNSNMGVPGYGGITRTGNDGSYSYSAVAGRQNMPVDYVSLYDTLRFANWMNNGQGNGDSETGSYTLLGGTPTPSNGTTVTRNSGATIVLTSENEWYKAAYYDSTTTSYFAYPAGSNAQTTCSAPAASPNSANCNYAVGNLTNDGSYLGSGSPYGTFDQGGNVSEFTETIVGGSAVVTRGGAFDLPANDNASSFRGNAFLSGQGDRFPDAGFRLAMIPEPDTSLLVIAGLFGLAGWRRGRAYR
jgi:formylglycine-generating enzyme required for sulfatase activity